MEAILNIRPKLKVKNDLMFKAFFSQKWKWGVFERFSRSSTRRKNNNKKSSAWCKTGTISKRTKIWCTGFRCRTGKGEFINVEIQLRNYGNIEERTTFYASKKIAEQLGPGEDFEKIKPVIVIAILDYNLTDLPDYVTETVRVAVNHRDYELNNDVKYYYIELSKFREQNPDMTLPVNQWLSFIDMEKGELLDMAEKRK